MYDVPIEVVQILQRNKFHRARLADSLKHKGEFLKKFKKYSVVMYYDGGRLEWTATSYSDPGYLIKDYEVVGTRGTNFEVFDNYTAKGYKASAKDVSDGSAKKKGQSQRRLFQSLWAGDLKDQLKVLNSYIKQGNVEITDRSSKIKLVSEREWLVWLGVFLSAALFGTNKLWNKSGLVGAVDLTETMPKYRYVCEMVSTAILYLLTPVF